jgi:hypothetical protein
VGRKYRIDGVFKVTRRMKGSMKYDVFEKRERYIKKRNRTKHGWRRSPSLMNVCERAQDIMQV